MTAAISAGSRPLSRGLLADDVLVRSGSVISCTASLNGGARRRARRRGDERDQDHAARPRRRWRRRAGGGPPLRQRVGPALAGADCRPGAGSSRCVGGCGTGAHGLSSQGRPTASARAPRRRRRSPRSRSPAPPSPPARAGAQARSSTAAWPRAAARRGAHLLVGDDRDRRVVDASMPASNSSGVSTTAAAGRRVRRHRLLAERDDASADPRPEQLLEPGALVRVGEGVAGDRGAVDDASGRDIRRPSARRRASRTSSSAYSSCTTASVDSVAAPSRSSAASAVDFPAPSPPVSPTNGTGACSARGPTAPRLLVGVRASAAGAPSAAGPRPRRRASARREPRLGLSSRSLGLGSRSLLGGRSLSLGGRSLLGDRASASASVSLGSGASSAARPPRPRRRSATRASSATGASASRPEPRHRGVRDGACRPRRRTRPRSGPDPGRRPGPGAVLVVDRILRGRTWPSTRLTREREAAALGVDLEDLDA